MKNHLTNLLAFIILPTDALVLIKLFNFPYLSYEAFVILPNLV